MKRFLSLLLTLCMLFTVITVSTVAVSAEESGDTVLYKMGTQAVAAQQDFSKWDDSKTDAENSATGVGSFTQTQGLNSTVGTEFVASKRNDGSYSLSLQKDATATSGRNCTYTFSNAENVTNENAYKVEYTFKVNGACFKTSDPTVSITSGNNAFIDFRSFATINGADTEMRAFWLQNGTTATRGTGCGAYDGYSEFSQFTTDADGYYNIKVEMYESNGAIYSYTYDALTNKQCGYFKRNCSGDYTVGNRFEINWQSYAAQTDTTLELYVKDFNAKFFYNGIGSIVAADSAVQPTLDTENNIISINPVANGGNEPVVSFVANDTVSTGNINVDFELKSEQAFKTDDGTIGNSGARYLGILGTSSSSSSFEYSTYNNSGKNFGRINGATFYTASKAHHYTTTSNIADTNGTYVPMRISFSRADASKGWSIACFDLNKSQTTPIFISYVENIGDFKGFNFKWYRPAAARGASSTNPALPKEQQPITVKNLVITKTDTITNTSTYGNYSSGTSTGTNKSPIRIDGNSYIFEDTIYVRTKSGQEAKAILAVKDANGKEVGKAETALTDGINYPVKLAVDGLTSPSTCTASLYIFDGENWLDGNAYSSAPETSIETVSVKSQIDGSTAVMRFIFKPTFDGTVTKFGAYVIPYDLFENKDTKAVNSYTDGSLASGSTYSVDLTKIPQTAYGRGVVALPYIVLDGETVQGDATDAYTVNDTNVQK